MIHLSQQDWSEIYYALETKSLALRQGSYVPEGEPGQDASWIAQLDGIKEKIGADGVAAANEGVRRNP